MNTVFGVIVLLGFFSFLGYLFGGSINSGRLAKTANEFPRVLFRVIYTDRERTVLERIGKEEESFLVSTKVFGGKPIRPKDVVRHIKSDKERKNADIPVLGYTPLAKVEGGQL